MKRNKKWWIVAAVLLLIAAVAFFALRWAWKYYGLPERPDRTEYKTIEERAEKALAFAQRHNMSEHYALFVDYGIPSGTPRLFLWDFRRKAIVASTYVMRKILVSAIAPAANAHLWGAFSSRKSVGTR